MATVLTVEGVALALRKHKGIFTYAAKECGVARMTLYRFVEANPELKDVRAECDEVLLDVGESHLANAIENGDLKTIRWHMERKGKDRGYTTRQETTGKDGAPLAIGTIERRVVKSDAQK